MLSIAGALEALLNIRRVYVINAHVTCYMTPERTTYMPFSTYFHVIKINSRHENNQNMRYSSSSNVV